MEKSSLDSNLRDEYGQYIVELGKKNKKIVVLEADLADSTQSIFFYEAFPERYLQMGIAEQNMVSVSAGLASEGFIPIVNSFAAFISMRACEQVRTDACYPNHNITFVVSHAGLSSGTAGPTHHTYEDIAIMRALPNMEVFAPGDIQEIKPIIDYCIQSKSPSYIRLSAINIPRLKTKVSFEVGKAQSIIAGEDVIFFTTGTMLHQGMKVVEALSRDFNISASLTQITSIKPLDKEAIIEASRTYTNLFTIEEHSIIGGLGSAVSEIVAETKSTSVVTRFGIDDKFCSVGGNYDFLLESNKIDPKSIATVAAKRFRANS